MENIMAGVALFQKGGVIMYVLLLCSLFVVATGVERWQYFRRMDAGRSFAADFAAKAEQEDWQSATALAKKTAGALPALLTQAMQRASEGRDIHAYLEIQSGLILARLRDRLYYLSVIVTLAPLLGLLGTISGMISAFSVFNVQSAQSSAITGGVGEALVATAFGLCVAILALIIHAYFTQRTDRILTDMEECCSLVESHAAWL
ncbi:MAG: MotA/TolQ/ExbB proton channel family protein [Selenomonas sp.]|jgi:biopolymer transport protein ExbB|nr:MotA/TolQ/ExbB proton channel family protein [Selenomonas sp.]MCI7330125.1 MotA/TolQ/ExbB proton channel family protein [Selenomonadaceae bacterium]MDD6119164.1 MotA/TolQ/ExbB proton channel family protein [Selenomonadaceae bacterium]MDD7056834.1 MotA/TolQ/ExbB proton channel family protein [Selenomonadaceae bacterium]HBT79403.1 MotA/TolQ/ExbB proton channel family protein [Selenomonas sp.]